MLRQSNKKTWIRYINLYWITGLYYTNNQDVTKGNSRYNVAGDVEEYRTIGIGNSTKGNAKNIGYNKADDITENSLRKEHGLPLRMRYVADE
jgi:hypothetical protein